MEEKANCWRIVRCTPTMISSFFPFYTSRSFPLENLDSEEEAHHVSRQWWKSGNRRSALMSDECRSSWMPWSNLQGVKMIFFDTHRFISTLSHSDKRERKAHVELLHRQRTQSLLIKCEWTSYQHEVAFFSQLSTLIEWANTTNNNDDDDDEADMKDKSVKSKQCRLDLDQSKEKRSDQIHLQMTSKNVIVAQISGWKKMRATT